jgi:tRNA(fMet)-specific endonuclease VapC
VSGPTHLLDTNVCVAFLRGASPQVRTQLLSRDRSSIGLPAIVAAELRLGAEKSARPRVNRALVEEFIAALEIIPFDDRASRRYAEIRARLERRGEPIGANDYIVAATALASGCILVTGNDREFRRVAGLKLEDWLK